MNTKRQRKTFAVKIGPNEKPEASSMLQHRVFRDGYPIGLIEKPRDIPGCVNSWRAFRGLGPRMTFVGHAKTQAAAAALVAAE